MILFDICFDERIKRDFFSKEYGIAECGNLTFKDGYSLLVSVRLWNFKDGGS